MCTGKVWFVTGVADRFSVALVNGLLENGCRVAATTHSLRALKGCVQEGYGDNWLPMEVNLSDINEIQTAIAATVDGFGRIDVVVNNVGACIDVSVREINEREIPKSLELNVFTIIRVLYGIRPYFEPQGNGHIINLCSFEGVEGKNSWIACAAIKHAVLGLSKVMAGDLLPAGIKVTAVVSEDYRATFTGSCFSATAVNQVIDLAGAANPPSRLFLKEESRVSMFPSLRAQESLKALLN